MNHGILDASQRGEIVQVWFHETGRRDFVAAFLIGRLDLLWNREGVSQVLPASSEPGRRKWPSAIRAAESARTVLIQNRALGERLFVEILQDHPNDGMVYMKRAEGREAVGDLEGASTDFARAESLVHSLAERPRLEKAFSEQEGHANIGLEPAVANEML